MPHPEVTVPKFGDWENNDLSYSIVFDKARADKERFLPTFKDGYNDPPSYHNSLRPPDSVPGSRTLNNASHNKRLGLDTAENRSVDGRLKGEGKITSIHNSVAQPTGLNQGYMSRNDHMLHENYREHIPSKPGVDSASGQRRQTHQTNPMVAKITRSQESSESNSRRVDVPEKTVVPKFGDWDASNAASGEGFTVIFNRARDEKKSKSTSESTWNTVSPSRPEEDLYQQSSKATTARKNQRGWINIMCCLHPQSSG